MAVCRQWVQGSRYSEGALAPLRQYYSLRCIHAPNSLAFNNNLVCRQVFILYARNKLWYIKLLLTTGKWTRNAAWQTICSCMQHVEKYAIAHYVIIRGTFSDGLLTFFRYICLHTQCELKVCIRERSFETKLRLDWDQVWPIYQVTYSLFCPPLF